MPPASRRHSAGTAAVQIITAFAIILFLASPAMSATINVTANATDTLNGADGQCSLREAITNINNSATTYADCAPSGAYGTSDTINIPAGTYTTAIAGTNENLNVSGDYDIFKNVTITGAGASTTIINGGSLDRVFHITGAYTVSISDLTITGGTTATGYSGYPASFGGGIYNSGTLSVTNSTINGNSASYMFSGGGGIYNSGTLNVTDSTITSNSSSMAGAGGGIYNSGTLSVTNSTIANNTSSDGGGGILNSGSGTLTVTNSTITGNTAAYGGGIYNVGSATFSNSIVANQPSGADCSGTITSNGHNLSSDASCGFTGTGDLQNTNPLLIALADNGGPTQTMALLTGSPAIDAGSCVEAADQRGTVRPQGATCDIGAYEGGIPGYTVTATAGSGGSVTPASQSVTSGSTASFTVTATSDYTTSTTVGGTCVAGSWSGTTYTTGAVTGACSVSFSFTANSYTVSATAGTGGTVSPASQSIASGSTTSFTVTANTGYTTSTTVGGTCVAGSWNGTTYTTGAVTSACSVSFSFTAQTSSYTVSATAGTGGSVTPASQSVTSGQPQRSR